jgi:hypothetical protein
MAQYATPAGSVSDENSPCYTDTLRRYSTAINAVTMHVFSFLQSKSRRLSAYRTTVVYLWLEN